MEFVEQPCPQILPDDGDATADADILAAGSFCRPLQRRLDAIGHEVKDSAALHLDGRARMMRQDKHRHVVGRVVSPPALPGMVGPPVRMSETPGTVRSPAPLLGEHTDQVLRERLGLSDEEIERLQRAGVVLVARRL